jgi:putative transposase
VDWPYSSFHRDLRRGIYTEDWGIDIDVPAEFGEPDVT